MSVRQMPSPWILNLGTTIDNIPLISDTLHMQEELMFSVARFYHMGFEEGKKYLFIPMRHFCCKAAYTRQLCTWRMVLYFPLHEKNGKLELIDRWDGGVKCYAWPIGWFSMAISGFVGDGIPKGIKTGVNKDGRICVLANQLKFYGGVLDKIPYSVTKDGFFKIDLPFISEFKTIRGYIPDYQAVDRNRGIWDVKADENGYAMFRACQCLIGDVSLNVPDYLVLEATNHAYSGGPHIREVLDDKWVEIVKEKRGKEAAERKIREQAERERRIREEQAREEAKRVAKEQERLQKQQMQEMLQGSTLFFDTETTGTPRNYKAPFTDSSNWPRLVQLAWIIADKNGNLVKKKSVIIKPDGFSILSDASAIHGITTERALREGKPLKEVLDEFITDLSFASQVVGHNIDFDQHIVGAELYRLNMDYSALMNKSSVCAMKSSVNYCAIPNPNSYYGGYKWPSLSELYRKLFGRSFDDAHDALADITATKDCYYELKRRGVI